MKFSTPLITMGLALGVAASPAPIVQRALEDFLGIISSINDAVTNLTPLVEGYEGGDATDIIDASNDIVAMINAGVKTADAQPELVFLDGVKLTDPVLGLIKDTETVINLLVDKKELAIENDIASDIKENLNAQFEAANRLAEAISSKMPAALEDIATDLANQISSAIKVGVDAYEDVKTPEPTESEGTPEPTETEGTPEPTETDEPEVPEPTETDEPEVPEPTETDEPEVPEPTDCAPGVTETVTVTITDCGPGAPEPTGENPVPPPIPTATGSFTVPQPPVPTTTGPPTPPDFDNAGVVNKVGGVGALAALAVVLAF